MGVSTMPAQSTQNAKFATSQQYIRKEVRDNLIFLDEGKHGTFLHAQSTQNNNFSKSLQSLKKKGRDEADFLDANKHQTFLQVDALNIGGQGQSGPKYPL